MLWNGETVIINKKSLGAFVFNVLNTKRFHCLVPNETDIVMFRLIRRSVEYGGGWIKQNGRSFYGHLCIEGHQSFQLSAKNKKVLKKTLQDFYKECNKISLGL